MNSQGQPSGHEGDGQDTQSGGNVLPQGPAATMPGTEQSDRSFYRPDNSLTPAAGVPTSVDPQMQDNGREVVWSASEFIAHHKSPEWFMGMVGGSVAVAVLVYFITRDIFNTVVVVIAAVIFGVAANRQPRQMQYAVNDHGVEIGRHFYAYDSFRSFSVVNEGPISSIVLMPLKRFMPTLTIYFDPADENRIGDVLIEHLPMHQHEHDLTERLMRRIRF